MPSTQSPARHTARRDPLPPGCRDMPSLSGRQLEVLQLLADGMDTEMIAGQVGLSEETVRTHIRRTATKLKATNRQHLVALGLRAGLID